MPLPLKHFLLNLLIAGFCFSLVSCSVKTHDDLYTPSEADQQFLKIVKDEFQYDATLRQSGKTLWIYVPGTQEIFKIKPAARPTEVTGRPFSVEFADGRFENRQFLLEYDIIPATKPPKPNTIATGYSTEFTEKYGKITNAVSRAYLNMETPPEFIVIVFADTKSGIEIINTVLTQDLKQYYLSAIPYEEYLLRVLTETNGNPNIIGDAAGEHLVYAEITFSEFLSRQIVNRVNFKFQQSDFPPQGNIPDELLSMVQSTFKAYNFSDFDAVTLEDVRSKSQETFNQEQVLK